MLPDSRWQPAAIAAHLLRVRNAKDKTVVIQSLAETLKISKKYAGELLASSAKNGVLADLPQRVRVGSAENAVTKLFPAAVTERHFQDLLERLVSQNAEISYTDVRSSRNYADFIIQSRQGVGRIPVNVKNAGTPFRQAEKFVGITSDDCVPIPTYKAIGAIESEKNLLYAISRDHDLPETIGTILKNYMSNEEKIVWVAINAFKGKYARDGEDDFVYTLISKYWRVIKGQTVNRDFRLISAKRAIAIMKDSPKRTPALSMGGWGTGAAAEVNVHISILNETMSWDEFSRRINRGIGSVTRIINKTSLVRVPTPTL